MLVLGCIIYFLCWLIQISYAYKYNKAGKYYLSKKNNESCATKNNGIAVSIIVCGKNEAPNLINNLASICEQQYSNFEVIFIDDNSTDNSKEIINKLQHQYPQLKYYLNTNSKKWKGKKSALDFGITKAAHDALLLTDADCQISGNTWLESMMADYNENTVVGYGPYLVSNNTWLEKWVHWETLHTFMQYSTYAYFQIPYMGVGRNMLISKKLYVRAIDNDSFIKTYNEVPSGDDDLLVQEMSKSAAVVVSTNKESLPYSLPPKNWKKYWQQKARHTSTGKYYHSGIKNRLAIYGLSHALFYLLFCAIFLYTTFLLLQDTTTKISYNGIILSLILSMLTKWIVTIKNFNIFNSTTAYVKPNSIAIIKGDFFWAIYNLILSPYILIKNQQKWKY